MGQREYTNYLLKRFEEQNPIYKWKDESQIETEYLPESLKAYGEDYVRGIKGRITVSVETPMIMRDREYFEFYTFQHTDHMIMSYDNRAFLMERCEEEPEEPLPGWGDKESRELLEKIYGEYQVAKFFPTKFFPSYYARGCKFPMLPQEEADMMIGKTIVISEETFVTYDNYREPTSETANRTEDGFWLDKIRMENPEYKVKTVRANEIYGIRDGMFTGELAQEEYVEVDAYPGYQTNREWSLPQMFLTSDGRILMYAMGEYFLLEKMENSQGRAESDNMPDLSGWIGRYAFSEEGTDYRSTKLVPSESNGYGGFYVYSDLEVYDTLEVTREYEIEIMKNSLGEYYAEIKIHEMEDGTDTLVKADVCGNSEKISFVCKEIISGEKEWHGSYSDILLRFQKDAGEICTYWEAFDELRESGKFFEKIE